VLGLDPTGQPGTCKPTHCVAEFLPSGCRYYRAFGHSARQPCVRELRRKKRNTQRR